MTPGDEAANELESKRELSSALSALFSNRCAARLQLDQGLEALSDARHCVELTPTWPKGHFREGCCLRQLNQLEDAQLSFATGLKLEPENKDWGKEIERTEKLLLAQPAYQAHREISTGLLILFDPASHQRLRTYLWTPLEGVNETVVTTREKVVLSFLSLHLSPLNLPWFSTLRI